MIDQQHPRFQWVLMALAGVFFGMLPGYGNAAGVLLLLVSLGFLRWDMLRGHGVFLLLIGQYLIFQLGLNLYHDGSFGLARLNDSYVIMGVGVALMMGLVSAGAGQENGQGAGLRPWIILGLVLSAGILMVDYLGLLGRNICRARGLLFNPLAPPFMMLAFIFVLALGWENHTRRARWIYFIFVLGLGGFLIAGLTGGRMAYYCFIALAPLLAVWMWARSGRKADLLSVLYVLIGGLMLSLALHQLTGCDLVQRFQNTANSVVFLFENLGRFWGAPTLSGPALVQEGAPLSEGYRVVLWQGAYQAFSQGPFFGYGQSQEMALINMVAQTGLAHAHNQYLSWAVWGGVPAVISGMLFLFAPLIVARRNHAMIGLATGAWALLLLTDSLLYWPVMLHVTILISCLLYMVGHKPNS